MRVNVLRSIDWLPINTVVALLVVCLVGCSAGTEPSSSKSSLGVSSTSVSSLPTGSASSAAGGTDDMDADGVTDAIEGDGCLNTVFGAVVDVDGCSSYQRGKKQFSSQACVACHGAKGEGGSALAIRDYQCSNKVMGHCGEREGLAAYISANMPRPNVCTDTAGSTCATDVANFMLIEFAPEVVIGDADHDGIPDSDDLCETLPQDKKAIDATGCKNLQAKSEVVFALNAGGEQYVSRNGTVFIADDAQYYAGSLGATTGNHSHDVGNTTDDVLYHKERWGSNLSYRVPLDNGSYHVVLHLAEVYFTEANKRVMDVSIEGQQALTGYDIFKKAGGQNIAKTEAINNITVSDGELLIELTGTTNNASVVAFEILSMAQNDGDSDGVADIYDDCPGTHLESVVTKSGCSPKQRDRDGDGVLIPEDQCPSTPANQTVDSAGQLAGCSAEEKAADTDGDNVPDVIDQCASKQGDIVGENGCTGLKSLENGDIESPQMRLTASQYFSTVSAAFDLQAFPDVTMLGDATGPFGAYTNNAADLSSDFRELVGAAEVIASAIAQQFAAQCNWQNNTMQCVKDHLSEPMEILYRGVKSAAPVVSNNNNNNASMIPADQCNLTAHCKALFGDMANDCSDSSSANSVCMCGAQRCDQLMSSPSPTTTPDIHRIAHVISESFDAGADVEEALSSGLSLMLVDYRFVYKLEFGELALPAGRLHLTPRELATRISYTLNDAPPQQSFIEALTQSNDFDTLLSRVNNMMSDDQFISSATRFIFEWLGMQPSRPLGNLNNVTVAAYEETRRFIKHILENDLPLSELFTADYSFINGTLAEHYGVPAPTSQWAIYHWPANTQRLGILTQAYYLQAHGNHGRDKNTIFRGKVIFERMFCDFMPPPPADAAAENENTSDRTEASACRGCHIIVDPIGRIFDAYDDSGKLYPGGAQRQGHLAMQVDIAGSYQNPVELGLKLGSSQAMAQCFSRQLYRFALGRDPKAIESTSFDQIFTGVSEGGSINDAIRTLVTSESFKALHIKSHAMSCEVNH
ncbi:malectin domain-containing carbohydrate-binding protein [Marinagarivorans algicola]|uniref:malectin domain-containing carbohydrate-binding protein n=1 Tax=Marinagarivorans algicola TaxID=1513270 RepID=UPI0009EADD68|nr:malectin domain-containing carbohydrate-binding protein [Marinagarivorans algicola]